MLGTGVVQLSKGDLFTDDDESFYNSQKVLLDAQAMLLELKDKGVNKADIDA